MTIRIVYFSWKGHTEKVATTLAGLLGAELERIESAGTIHIGWEGMKALFRLRSPIRPAKSDLSGIDTLVIACPVWAGKVPGYMNKYLDSVTNCSGKPFHVLVEMGGRGDASAIAVVRQALERKGMNFVSSASTVEKDVESGLFRETVERFAAGIRHS